MVDRVAPEAARGAWPVARVALVLSIALGLAYGGMILFLATNAWLIDDARTPPPTLSESVNVGLQSDYLVDFGDIADIDDLLAPETLARFVPAGGEQPISGMQFFRGGMMWLRFTVPAVEGDDGQRTIRLADPRVREAMLLVVMPDGSRTERNWRLDDDARRSGLSGRVPAFHFSAGEIEGATAYLGFSSLSLLRGAVFVETRRAYEAWDARQIVLPSIFGGALITLAVYLLAIGLVLREWPILWAGGMAAALASVIFGGAGLIHTFLMPAHPAIADAIAYLPKPLAVSAWLAFLVSYLRIGERVPWLYWLLVFLALLLPFQSALAGLYVGLGWNTPLRITSSGPFLVALVCGGATLIHDAWRGERAARIFLICWLPLLLGTIGRSLIILFPTAGTATLLNQDVFFDIVLSMVALAIAIVLDIQAREARLRHAAQAGEMRLREYSEIASDSFFETDASGRIVTAAGPVVRELALIPGTSFLGHLSDRLAAPDRERLDLIGDGIERGSPFRGVELSVYGLDGSTRWLGFSAMPWHDASGAPGGMRGAIVDITAQVERRGREAQHEKLAAMGQIAGGIAHEVNNLLHPIINLARRVRDTHVRDQDGRRMLDLVIDSGKRAGEVVEGVLNAVSPVARRGPLLPLAMALERAVSAISASLPPTIRLEVEIDPIVEPQVALGEMLQVLGNLAQNAVRATGGRGTIAIRLVDTPQGARFSVSDDGAGMPEAIRSSALQPFVTSGGEGTGLGLSAVAAIVGLWEGSIDIESTEGNGATVTIRFPKGYAGDAQR
jgi:signal transduction histidine kinase